MERKVQIITPSTGDMVKIKSNGEVCEVSQVFNRGHGPELSLVGKRYTYFPRNVICLGVIREQKLNDILDD